MAIYFGARGGYNEKFMMSTGPCPSQEPGRIPHCRHVAAAEIGPKPFSDVPHEAGLGELLITD